jgi:hypothetical protein
MIFNVKYHFWNIFKLHQILDIETLQVMEPISKNIYNPN